MSERIALRSGHCDLYFGPGHTTAQRVFEDLASRVAGQHLTAHDQVLGQFEVGEAVLGEFKDLGSLNTVARL